MRNFWTAALGAAGVAAIGLFVFYSLYKQILKLGILVGLTQTETFVVVIIFLLLVFLIAVLSIWAWLVDNQRKRVVDALNFNRSVKGIEFDVPQDCTFQKMARALAQAEKTTVSFDGFTDGELNTKLYEQKMSATSTALALEQLRNLADGPVSSYDVKTSNGSFQLIAKR